MQNADTWFFKAVTQPDIRGQTVPLRWTVQAIWSVNLKKREPGYFKPLKGHPCHEFIYVVSGTIMIGLGQKSTVKKFCVKPGELLVIPGGLRHSVSTLQNRRPMSFLNGDFDGEIPTEMGGRPIPLTPVERRIMAAVIDELASTQPYRQEMMLLCLNELFFLIRRRKHWLGHHLFIEGKNIVYHRNLLVGRALDYVNRHLADPLNTAAIAAHAGISPSHLRALIRKKTGMSLRQHLRQIRIEAAKNLLLQSPYDVNEISGRVGYHSPPHFCTVFKRLVKMTPSTYARLQGLPAYFSGPSRRS